MKNTLFFLLGFFITTIFVFGTQASETDSLRVLVSVQDLHSDSKALTQKICEKVALQISMGQSMQVSCAPISAYDLSNEKVNQLLTASRYNYHLEVIKLSSSEKIEVVTHNLTPFDGTDFKNVSNYYTGSEDEMIDSVANHLSQLGHYHFYQPDLRRKMVSDMAPMSSLVRIDQISKKIYDPRTGLNLTWSKAYQLLIYETIEHEKVARAFIELSVSSSTFSDRANPT